MHEVLIKGGTVVDGTGRAAFTGDVAISGGVIAEVGKVTTPAARIIEADGALVTPGFIDIHTHYDGQVSWDAEMLPSANHGVTTAIMGNCGVGFAPARSRDRKTLIALMEGVEDIPGTALHEGITWEWETMGEYIDAIDRIPRTMDIGVQVPHNPLRLYVMGERAVRREAATPGDIAAMQALLCQALEDGALGFTTADTVGHRDAHGNPTYARQVAASELYALGEAMGRAGKGVIQIFNDFYRENAGDFPTIAELARRSGRPLSFTYEQDDAWPEGFHEYVTGEMDALNAAGVPIRAQVAPRAIGGVHSLQGTINPFMTRPSYLAIMHLSHAERVAIMCDPAFKAQLMTEEDRPISDFVMSVSPRVEEWGADPIRMAQRTFCLDPVPDYEQPLEASLYARSQASGRSVPDLLYDQLLTQDGKGQVFVPIMNWGGGNYDFVHDTLNNPWAILGLSDGGAHVGYICDGSFPTYLLSHWTRDRTRGPRIAIERAVQLQTTAPAEHLGLHDRGRIAPGYRADINVIDHAALAIGRPTLKTDLPAGGTRFVQSARGYLATMVAGSVVTERDTLTGASPGRVVRGAQRRAAA
jgi:N-acyl-D-aspartate/D-glutamate deacylase